MPRTLQHQTRERGPAQVSGSARGVAAGGATETESQTAHGRGAALAGSARPLEVRLPPGGPVLTHEAAGALLRLLRRAASDSRSTTRLQCSA
jgi:hypothetical protein